MSWRMMTLRIKRIFRMSPSTLTDRRNVIFVASQMDWVDANQEQPVNTACRLVKDAM
jgi:hypothetical protein